MRIRKCSQCKVAHEPPTGRNCTRAANNSEMDAKLDSIAEAIATLTVRVTAVEGGADAQNSSETEDTQMDNTPAKKKKVKKDKKTVKKPKSPSESEAETSDTDEDARIDTTDVRARAQRRLMQLGIEGEQEKRGASAHTSNGKPQKNWIDWPHFYIYNEKGEVQYEALSLAQFAQGFSQLILNAPPAMQNTVQRYFSTVMEDAARYKWEVVRNCHYIVGNMMEQGRLRWKDSEELLNLRRNHVWQVPNALLPTRQHAATAFSTPCPAFQAMACPQHQSHPGADHVCAYCYKATGRACHHPEAACRRRHFDNTGAKNGMLEH